METWLWSKVKSATVVMQKMSHARRTYVAWDVACIQAAHFYQEKIAGWFYFLFVFCSLHIKRCRRWWWWGWGLQCPAVSTLDSGLRSRF